MAEPQELQSGNTQLQGAYSQQDYRDQAAFRCAIRRFFGFAEEQARNVGLTPQQALALLVVRGHVDYPNVSVGAVAECLQVRHHSASLLVDRCVKRGLLYRREDPVDRRRALLSLTEKGQYLLDEIITANRREMAALEDALFRDSLRQALRRESLIGA